MADYKDYYQRRRASIGRQYGLREDYADEELKIAEARSRAEVDEHHKYRDYRERYRARHCWCQDNEWEAEYLGYTYGYTLPRKKLDLKKYVGDEVYETKFRTKDDEARRWSPTCVRIAGFDKEAVNE